jgi:hypothetical protein
MRRGSGETLHRGTAVRAGVRRTHVNHGFRRGQTKDGGYLPALSGLAEVGVALAMAAAFF